MAQPISFKAKVERVKRHDVDVCTYQLRSTKRLPKFTPGQFIHLAIDEYDPASYWPESRVFSAANAVADCRTVCLTISRQGSYTARILDELEPGKTVWGKGPYGEFKVDGSQGFSHAVLIAGGTGVTPFCAFMDASLSRRELPVEQATLYYGARRPDLLIYRSLADRCAETLPGFRVRYYSEHAPQLNDPSLVLGQIDIQAILKDVGDASAVAFYVSGPKSMVDLFRSRLNANCDISDDQVFIDDWN